VSAERGTAMHWLFFQAWGLMILGGGLCGVVSFGIGSVIFFVISFPVGAVLGALIGLPVAGVLTIVIGRFATPPQDPAGFTRALGRTGLTVGLVACVPALAFDASAVLDALGLLGTPDFQPSVWQAGAYALNTALAVAAVALIGRSFGRTLAKSHLRRCGIGPPTDPPIGGLTSSGGPTPRADPPTRESVRPRR